MKWMSWILVLAAFSTRALAADPPAVTEPVVLTVHADRVIRPVPRLVFGHNLEWVWGGQRLFKEDGSGPVAGLTPLIRALEPGLIRYPGGSLANTFRWADSIGPLAQRKPIANFFTIRGQIGKEQLTYQTERPLLGFDDFMRLVSDTAAAGAILIVNCTPWPHNPELSGSAQEAAAWVAYANAKVGDAPIVIGKDERGVDWRDSQHWARLRAANGHPQPYGVRYWEIGNEVYDRQQGAGMDGPAYASRAIEFARLMKAVDPTIQIGLVIVWEQPAWNQPVIQAARQTPGQPALVDFLIPHKYGPGITGDSLALWNTGSTDVPLSIEQAGRYTLILEASGQPAQGVFPQMRLAMDGTALGEYVVDAHKWQNKRKTITHTLDLARGDHKLTVSFLNDVYAPPEDRNLFVEAAWLQPEGGQRTPLMLQPIDLILQQMSQQADMVEFYLRPIRQQMKSAGVSLPFHFTEYNAMYGTDQAKLRLSRDLKSAMYSARHVQLFLQDPSIEGANFWCIKSAWFLVVEPGPKGLRYAPAGEMFRTFLPMNGGDIVTHTWQQQPSFKANAADRRASAITAVACRKANQLILNFVNWQSIQPARIRVRMEGTSLAEPRQEVRILSVSGPGANAVNIDGRDAVITSTDRLVRMDDPLQLEIPPLSVTTVIYAIAPVPGKNP